MRSIVLVCALLVTASAGCATATPVNGPDGAPGWYAVTCRRNQSNCVEKAGEVCPGGYITADSHGRTGVVMTANQYGAYATTTYNGEMLIKCGSSAPKVERPIVAEVDPAVVQIQKHPKYPEIGAMRLEAKATCEHERGQWVDQDTKIGCKLAGSALFACTLADNGTVQGCTHWKMGAEITDERDTIVESLGKPTSVAPGDHGFRVYTWAGPSETITLTGYPAGVIVTEAKKE